MTVDRLVEWSKRSDLDQKYLEQDFGRQGGWDPIRVPLGEDRYLRLIGQIDRIDEYTKNVQRSTIGGRICRWAVRPSCFFNRNPKWRTCYVQTYQNFTAGADCPGAFGRPVFCCEHAVAARG